ncbi:MAG: cell division protein FtsH, partial [Caldilinea sp.]
LVAEAHDRCHTLLSSHWPVMQRVAARLLEVETLNAAEFAALMKGEVSTDHPPQPRPTSPTKSAGPVRGDDKRPDAGLDLSGRVPQPV